MDFLREVLASLATGLVTAWARPRHTLLIAFGFLVAAITLAILLALPAGLRRLAGNTGSPDIAVVLSGNSFTESGAAFASGLTPLVGTLPGVARGPQGQPLVAPQFVVETRLRRTDGSTATVLVRGVTPAFWSVLGRRISMRSGQRFASGRDELIAGIAAARGFVALDPGDTVSIHATPWRVTGNFAAGGGFWESELWTGMAVLQSAYHAPGSVTCLWVRLTSPAAFVAFKRALRDNPRTESLRALRQPDYYRQQAGFLESLVTAAAQGVAVALGLGAILAVVNALEMALRARRRELAVQRAVGFRRSALAVSLLVEVLVIAAMCAAITIGVTWLAVNGHEVGSSTGGSAIQFRMHVGAGVAGWTFLYVLVLGILSAIRPVVRAVRAPLARLLQSD